VTVNRSFLCLRGDDPLTTKLTFNDNANSGSDLNTMPSVNVTASDVSALNLTFENSTALGGSQAIALRATANRIQFRNCRFLSYQDTLYVWGGTEYFRDCTIQGTVDYVFGPATAVLQNCTLYNASGGSAVAAPNTRRFFSTARTCSSAAIAITARRNREISPARCATTTRSRVSFRAPAARRRTWPVR
jgi:pectin methylesterase-like acyl-CoA thioesterase